MKKIRISDTTLRDASAPVMHLVIGTSDIYLRHKLNWTRAHAVQAIARATRQARRHAATVQFSFEDATRSDPIFLRQCAQTAVEAGATRINIADTAGCMTPDEFGPLIADMVEFLGPDVLVSAHCHNDLGLATPPAIPPWKRSL